MSAHLPAQIGPYRILRRLRGGGFSEMFLGRDTRPHNYGGLAALKRLRPGLIHRDPVFLDSLLNEAEIGMMLSDPHVVKVEGVLEDGEEPVLAMEYVHGRPLNQITRCFAGVGCPPEFATEVGRQVCEGLIAVHEVTDAGGAPLWVVHQDIKPGNLMICRDGTLKIVDLGVARPQRSDRSTTWVGRGTPGYRAPEQTRGDRWLTPACDIYGLGASLYELLVGKPLFPFRGEMSAERELERQQKVAIQMEVEAARVAPPGLDLILARMLAFDPTERYKTAYDLLKELAHWQYAWNKDFNLAQFLEAIEGQLSEPEDDPDDSEDIHSRGTSPGVRLAVDTENLEGPMSRHVSGLEEPMKAVRYAPFDAPVRPPPLRSHKTVYHPPLPLGRALAPAFRFTT